jgi:hypothetical protein
MARMARLPRRAVRLAPRRWRYRPVPSLHRAGRSTAERVYRGVADLRPARREIVHPRPGRRLSRCLPGLVGIPRTGERGTIKVIACDRKQVRVIHRYCRALLTKVPAIAGLVERDGDEEIDLSNGISVEIQTASFRSVRGYTLIAALCDEIAFWRSDESANPDSEILAALRPAMSTIPGAMLLCASSPYAKRGALWDTHRRHYGKPGPVLVWRADTRTMNPTVPQRVIDEAFERDPASAAAEYGATFRSDVDTFLSRELVETAIDTGVVVPLAPAGRALYRFCGPQRRLGRQLRRSG